MNLTFKVNGLQKVSRILLKTLPDEVVKQLSSAVKEEATAELSMAEAAIRVKTGATKEQLKIKYRARGLVARIGVFGADAKMSRAFIARFLEFGTKHQRQFPFLLEPTRSRRAAFGEKLRQRMTAALRTANDELRS